MQPNLREYSIEEAGNLGIQWMELEEQGRFEEAEAVLNETPITPGMAQQLKEDMGIEALIATGVNLSRAVKEYGTNWLTK